MTSIVSVQNATKSYRLGNVLVPALRGVSLEIGAGEFLSIAGPSGSGKTTLLNLIGCVDTPSSGVVQVDGRDISQLSERALTDLRLHTLGFIFQSFNLVSVLDESFNLVSVLDVYGNVELPLLLKRVSSSAARKQRVRDMLARVGLSDFAKHRPAELSGGQRQRVAIARALVTQPKLVLADEPTANLDSVTGESILNLMRELNQREHTTFIFSTHDARVMSYASRLIRIADGRISEVSAAAPAERRASALQHGEAR
jgi:putative ABC transport system ATP-binding protein